MSKIFNFSVFVMVGCLLFPFFASASFRVCQKDTDCESGYYCDVSNNPLPECKKGCQDEDDCKKEEVCAIPPLGTTKRCLPAPPLPSPVIVPVPKDPQIYDLEGGGFGCHTSPINTPNWIWALLVIIILGSGIGWGFKKRMKKIR